MRILFLAPCGRLGGAERIQLEVLRNMRTERPAWHYSMIIGEEGPFADRIREMGFRVECVPFPKSICMLGDSVLRSAGIAKAALWSLLMARAALAVPSYVRRLRAAIRRHNPDVIHSSGPKMHVLGAWAKPRSATLLWHVHDFVGQRPIISRLLARLQNRCHGAIAISKSVASDMKRSIGAALPIHEVYSAIDTTEFTPEGRTVDLDALAGIPPAPEGTVRVGLVGTFARWKGHDVFLKAMAKLPSALPARGYVVGGPVYSTVGSQFTLPELKKMAKAFDPGMTIGFTGFVDDTASVIRSLDIVVHASTLPEPFGLVIVEGQACGRPVIAADAGGAREIVRPGINGYTHTPGDADELAARIAELVLDPEKRRRLGADARKHAVSEFSSPRFATEMTAIYEAL